MITTPQSHIKPSPDLFNSMDSKRKRSTDITQAARLNTLCAIYAKGFICDGKFDNTIIPLYDLIHNRASKHTDIPDIFAEKDESSAIFSFMIFGSVIRIFY